MTEPHYDESADTADTVVTTDDIAAAEPDEAEPGQAASDGAASDAAEPDAAEPDAAASDEAEPVADPRVRDAVRRLDELSELPPADHVEVYEAVHSSLQESLAEASRQADESPPDGSSAS